MRRLAPGLALVMGLLAVGWIPGVPIVEAQELSAAQLRSRAAVLMDAGSGRVLFELNAHEPLPPASTTKIMTLLLALEAIRDGRLSMDDMVTTSARARSMGGTQIWLETGEQMSVRDLLHAIAIGSANDASVAIAEHLAGSEQAFAQWMNRRARELGARNTHFSNASGLPPEDVGMAGEQHVTSAYDLAVISRHALKIPGFLNLVSQYGPYQIRPNTPQHVELWNVNRMLRTYPGMDGIKTGMTQAAGYCLAATAQRDGLRLIAVVLGAPTRDDRTNDVRTLLDWGFARYRAHRVVEAGEEVGLVAVRKGDHEQVRAIATEGLSVAVPRFGQVTPEIRVEWETSPLAPVGRGQVLGKLYVLLEGEVVGQVDLVAASEVRKASAGTLVVRSIRHLMTSLTPR